MLCKHVDADAEFQVMFMLQSPAIASIKYDIFDIFDYTAAMLLSTCA